MLKEQTKQQFKSRENGNLKIQSNVHPLNDSAQRTFGFTIVCAPILFEIIKKSLACVAIKLQALKTPDNCFLEQMNGDNSGEPRQAKDGIDGLNRFLNSIWNTSTLEKKRVSYRQANINYLRCQSEAFILSQKTINSVTIDHHFSNNSTTERGGRLKIASTPKELLMMRKSLKERANDLDGIIKKCVFCAPKTSCKQS